jgi:hypothetical protein
MCTRRCLGLGEAAGGRGGVPANGHAGLCSISAPVLRLSAA